MKTISKLTLAGITAALVTTGGAFAHDTEWQAVDNHHGAVIHLARPVQKEVALAARKEVTIALAGHRKSSVRANGEVKRTEGRFQEVSTPHGTVNYFAPAE